MATQGKERTLVILETDGQTSLAIADRAHVLGDERTFDLVLENLARDERPGTRADVAGAIARLPITQRTRELLLELSVDESSLVSEQARKSLAKIREQESSL